MRLLPLALTLICVACSREQAVPVTTPPIAAAAAPAPAVMAAPESPAVVDEYLAALAMAEKSTAPTSLEALFNKAEAAQTALMEVTGEQAVLERYTDAQFTALQAQLRGLKLNRGLDIYAQPEPVFFLALAQKHGQPADIAFFTLYANTWGADLVPNYLKLRPQPTPCVRFGEGKIAPLYAGWKTFISQHAGAYTAQATQNLKDLEETVALGTCACDGLESVRNEQADFLKRFPDAPQAAVIKARRAQLASDPDKLPVNCR